MIRKLSIALAPGALVLAIVAIAIVAAPQSVLLQAARGYPYIVFIVAALFAWRLHRPRLLALAVVLLAVHVTFASGRVVLHPLAVVLFASFLPGGIAALSFMPERGLFRHFAVILAPIAIAGFFSAANPPRAVELLDSNLIAGGVASFIALVNAIRTQRSIEAGLVWITVAVTVAMAMPVGSTAHGVWMLAAGIVLAVTLVETAYALAYHDELTGLPSRRALTRALADLETPYAVAVIDVDHFKSFNDEYGHDVGDQVLRMVAGRLARVSGGGKAYRAGGEEFTLVFPGLNKREAAEHVEKVRAAVANAAFVLRNHPRPSGKKASKARGRTTSATKRLQVTVSAGVAAAASGTVSHDEVLAKADAAMYRAKNGGRNCVVA